MAYSQDQIERVIDDIDLASEPSSVTNVMVAAVLRFLLNALTLLSASEREIVQKLETVSNQLTQASNAIGSLHDDLGTLEGNLNTVSHSVTDLKRTVKLNTGTLGELSTSYESLRTDLDTLQSSSSNAFKQLVSRVNSASRTADTALTRVEASLTRIVELENRVGDCGCSGGGGVADVERISDEEIDALFGSAVAPPEMPADAVAISFDEIEALALTGCDVCDHGSIPDDGISIGELDELLTK